MVTVGHHHVETGAHHTGHLELAGQESQVRLEAPGAADNPLDLGQDRRQERHAALEDEGDDLGEIVGDGGHHVCGCPEPPDLPWDVTGAEEVLALTDRLFTLFDRSSHVPYPRSGVPALRRLRASG